MSHRNKQHISQAVHDRGINIGPDFLGSRLSLKWKRIDGAFNAAAASAPRLLAFTVNVFFAHDRKYILIGKRFAGVRKAKGLSQVDFSKQLEVSSATIANIERGFIYPNMDLLYYLIFKEGVNPYWLFPGIGEMFSISKNIGLGINLNKQFADPEVKEMIDLLNVPRVKRSLLSYVDQLREIFSVDIEEYLKRKSGTIESSQEMAANE